MNAEEIEVLGPESGDFGNCASPRLDSPAIHVSPFSSSANSSARPRLLPIVSQNDRVDPVSWPLRSRHCTTAEDVHQFRKENSGTNESSPSPIEEDLGEPHEPPYHVDPETLLRTKSLRSRIIQIQDSRIFPPSDWFLAAMEERLVRWRPPVPQANVDDALRGHHPYQIKIPTQLQGIISDHGVPSRSLSTSDSEVLKRHLQRTNRMQEGSSRQLEAKATDVTQLGEIVEISENEPNHKNTSNSSTMSTNEWVQGLNQAMPPNSSDSFFVPLEKQKFSELTTLPPSSIFRPSFPLSRSELVEAQDSSELSELHPMRPRTYTASPFDPETVLEQFGKDQQYSHVEARSWYCFC
ncbi:unnamed protein product [Kuraishia capsulata CBS 1993]|uniref:Uncharacterized protein n=1 Tax=Kuraishia capsulata CBS 1993 TaxID=1382522 RepID=W6MT55_9ASCO|nr:uncharacterized protein KUCA_T00005550001 [Kuraishia capsulata CBS 1993]CDK29558.1 unnamed protein product [Kuraishia capsulata CBS 1993]